VTTDTVRVTPEWLDLREPADAAARSVELVEVLVNVLPGRSPTAGASPLVVHDLGCGTGSMARWLAPLLANPQRWVLHDRDPDLLDRAALGGAAGVSHTFETRVDDITNLPPEDLGDASLITASALLDMFTREELDRFVQTCAAARCPAFITLTVTGRVELAPADPLDRRIQDAFNAHQRRTADGRTLLGPDAVGVAAETFANLGYDVTVRPSPWHLEPHQRDLVSEWLTGWVGAAVDLEPDLEAGADGYLRLRLDQLEHGLLNVSVQHDDLLAIPR
jgi:SAM-dependent methyltransferase